VLTNQYALGSTHLVVFSYERITSASDVMRFWIDPDQSTFGAGSAPTASQTMIVTSESSSFNGLDIKTSSNIPADTFWDEVRIGTTWASVVPAENSAPPGDTDSDGIPNEWETKYFGGATNANPNALAANGVNTVMETYIADLNPTNAQSFFTVSNRPASSQVTLQWSAASGRVYSVHWTTNLFNNFQPLGTNILWPQNSWTDTVNGVQSRSFYRIKVRLDQ
jgi:hypothetical protein